MNADLHEDAACGRGCGEEPIGCITCEKITGNTYHGEDDEWYADHEDTGDVDDDGEGCRYCEPADKCSYCAHGAGNGLQCPTIGPNPEDRPDWSHMLALMTQEIGTESQATNLLWSDWDAAREACSMGCKGCDYEWQKEERT